MQSIGKILTMNRRGVNRAFDEKIEVEKSTHNRFKNPIRGNIKSNAQVDSFTKSQEVFKLLQNTLGTPAIPVVSKSFRIPLKHSPARDTSNAYSKFRNNDQERHPRNDRNSFDNQYARRDNSRQNNRGNNDKMPSDRELFSRRERSNPSFHDNRRCNEPSTSSFSNYSRKRPHDDSYSRGSIESPMPKYSDYNEIMDRGNNAWRGEGKPESMNQFSFNRPLEHNQLQHSHFDSNDSFQYKSNRSHQDMPRGNNYTSVHIQQGERSISTERHLDNVPSNTYDFRSREICSSSERFPRDRDAQKWPERSLSRERYSPNAFNSRSRESCPSNERFSCDTDAQKWPTDDHRGQKHHQLNDMCSREKYESNRPRTDRFAENDSTHSKQKEKDKGKEAIDKSKKEDAETIRKRKKAKRVEKRIAKKSEKSTLGKPCKLEIIDNAEPMGKIAEHNVPKLIEVIFKFLKDTTMTNRLTYPRFFGHSYNDGRFIVVCGDYSSLYFLRQGLEKMPPIWKGASLGYVNIVHYEKFVDAKIPKTIHHFSEFRSLCEEGNSELNTSTWRLIAYQDCDDDDRRLYTIGMEVESYNMIADELKGLVRCGDEFINFVLRENLFETM